MEFKIGDKVKLKKITEDEYKKFGIFTENDRLGDEIVTIKYLCSDNVTFEENKTWCYRLEWMSPILNILADEGEY